MEDALSTPVTEGKNKSTMMKILVPIFTVILFLILIIVKKNNEDFPLFYVIVIGAVILILGAIGFFGAEIMSKFNRLKNQYDSKTTLPEPASTTELWEKVKNSLTNSLYKDHIKEYLDSINHSVGKNAKSLVVEFKVKTLYRPREECSILINANYPKRMPSILFSPNQYQLRQAIQSMSFDPEDPANETIIETRNDFTGTTSRVKEKTYGKKENKNSEKKEGLV